jgi:hypothetical protein
MAVRDVVDILADPDYINQTLMWLVRTFFFDFNILPGPHWSRRLIWDFQDGESTDDDRKLFDDDQLHGKY